MWKPVPSADDHFYFEGWERGELLAQRCSACGTLRHPPSPCCGSCRSLDWEAVPVGGRGEVYSYVIPRKPSLEGLIAAPVVALVQLDEGLRVLGNLMDVAPEAVAFGMPVELDFLDTEDGFRLPVFRPR